ncbi:phage tail tape measure protein [Psychrobacillus sp. INOP01]|uniref:phage tail tape measure protein n=1 Tax=Psychrobacillus sp. INOP01 TaxID=2829187 RepID=UPI001BAB027F|nr:phage tail tape measure protein [Psychrobacillus sp. INOP01]QUG41311.1 phage tail tape measure protein [Psychrobacillus sp. INOP01]
MQESIIVQIGANITQFQNAINQVSGDLRNVGNDMTSFGTKMAKGFGAATLAVGAGLGFAVKQASDFDTEMRKAGAIAGASAKELDAMKTSALDLGASTSESASSVAAAMTEMAAKGFTANQTIAAMPGVIAAAEASGEDLALAADTVASALNIFGLEAGESSRVADILAMTANMSAAGITDMQYALKYAGAPAAALGISMEELSASIGILTNAGLDGSSAGTSLRASLLALNNPAKAQAKMMDALGFSLTDSEGKTKSMADMVRDLTASMEHMTEAEKVATLGKLVGTEAVSGFLALMKAGPEAIEANTLALQNSAGAAAETAAQMKAGIGGAMENLSGAFETAAIMIGNQLIPYVQSAAGFIAELINKFNGLSEVTQAFITKSALVTAGLLAVGTGIGILIAFTGTVISAFATITGVMATVATSLGITGGAMGLLGAAFTAITGPIGIAVAAVAGIVAALVVAYNKVDWFRDMVNSAWTKVKEGTVIAFNAVKSAITTAISAVLAFVKPQLDKFKAFWDENGKAITTLAKSYFTYLQTMITGVMGVIKGVFQTVWPIISSVVKVAWETIKLVISSAIDIVLGVVQAGLKLLQGDWKGALDSLLQVLKDVWGNVEKFFKGIDLADIGKDIIRGLIKGISGMAGSVKTAVKDLANLIPDGLKKFLGIHSPSKVTEEDGKWTTLGFAKGITGEFGTVIKAGENLAKAAHGAIALAAPKDKSSKKTKARAKSLLKVLATTVAPKFSLKEVTV